MRKTLLASVFAKGLSIRNKAVVRLIVRTWALYPISHSLLRYGANAWFAFAAFPGATSPCCKLLAYVPYTVMLSTGLYITLAEGLMPFLFDPLVRMLCALLL